MTNSTQRGIVLVLCAGAVLALYFDPYSHGQMGWEYMQVRLDSSTAVPLFPWQMWVAAASAALLMVGAATWWASFKQYARIVLTIEAAGFFLVNLFYIARDSLAVRAIVGDEGNMYPGLMYLMGLLTRFGVLILMYHSDSRRENSSSDSRRENSSM